MVLDQATLTRFKSFCFLLKQSLTAEDQVGRLLIAKLNALQVIHHELETPDWPNNSKIKTSLNLMQDAIRAGLALEKQKISPKKEVKEMLKTFIKDLYNLSEGQRPSLQSFKITRRTAAEIKNEIKDLRTISGVEIDTLAKQFDLVHDALEKIGQIEKIGTMPTTSEKMQKVRTLTGELKNSVTQMWVNLNNEIGIHKRLSATIRMVHEQALEEELKVERKLEER